MVEESDAHSTAWVDTLVAIPLRFHDSERSIRELFVSARPDLSDRNRFVTTVAERLRAEPTLIDAWQQFSYDNRGTPSPYLAGVEVGLYDRGRRDVARHTERANACADFIFRKAEQLFGAGQ